MISVVRGTESQLLPDVGAIVTCKVRNEEKLLKVTLKFHGFSQYLIILSHSGDQHQPKIRQSPHLKSWIYVIEGPLQRNSQVTGQMKAPVMPFNLFHCNILMAEPAPSYRKEDVRATEKDKVCLSLLCLFLWIS